MKKLVVSISIIIAAVGSLYAQNRSVDFQHTTFAEVLAKAKAENKPIFLDAYTTWCGPCKYMATKIFTQDKVADFFNANFVSTKFDMEKGEGLELAKKYGVKVYPTFLVLDSDGNIIHRLVGSNEAEPFMEKVKLSLNPETSLKGQTASYEKGNRDQKFVRSYLTTLQDAYMEKESEAVAQEYLKSLKENERVSKENWNVYSEFVNDVFSKDFMFILTNRLAFVKAVGDSAVNAKIESSFSAKTMALLENRRGTVYTKEESKKVRDFIGTCGLKDAADYYTILDMADAKASKNGSAIAAIGSNVAKSNNFDDISCLSILSASLPVAIENATKDDLMLLSAALDTRIGALKEARAKKYYDNLKQQISDKLNPPAAK